MTDPVNIAPSRKSKPIEWLRFFCAICVVFLHAGIPSDAQDTISCHNGISDTLRIIISHGFCRVAVPIFFIISGYLFFIGLTDWDFRQWGSKLKKRVNSLLIPYILWNILSILVSWGAHEFVSTPIIHNPWSVAMLYDTGTGLPHNYPLWFIRNLMILNLLAPLIYVYVRRTRIFGIVILFLLYFFNYWTTLPGFEATGFFFYSLGALISISQLDMPDLCRKIRLPTAIAAVPLLLLMILSHGHNPPLWEYTHRIFALIGSISTIGIVTHFIDRIKVSDFLSKSAFFVYAAHGTIVLPLVQHILRRLLPSSLVIQYLSAPLLTIGILLLCYWLLTLYMPRITKILVGGR